MKGSVFKSFRFEIVLYSLISLLYTMLTVAAVGIGFYLIRMEIVQHTEEISKTTYIFLAALSIIMGTVIFIAYFLLLTKKFVLYIKQIAVGINQISKGNFDYRVQIKNDDEFARIAEDLNQMAEDIKEIMENERRNEDAKNELITSIAHDLRTPLTSIIGYLDLVSNKEITEEVQQSYIEIAYSKSKRLENLINDLFTYTKFNFGEVKPDDTEVDMVKLIHQLLDEFYPSFTENQLDYEFHTNNSTALIKADGDLLARAFANLISNAIKYGKEGKFVHFDLEYLEDQVVVTVSNYGRMIPKKDLEAIFERFYRVETSRSSETGGSGLGLAIAKSIIEMHGGAITASSNHKKTEFKVVLNKMSHK